MNSFPQGNENKITCLRNFRVKNELTARRWDCSWHKHLMGEREATQGRELFPLLLHKGVFESKETWVPHPEQVTPHHGASMSYLKQDY